jgi:GGDEF domain-containing protein
MIHHLLRLQIAHKISLTIILVGLLGLAMVYYTSAYYRDIAYEHHQRTIRVLTALKVEEQIKEMHRHSTDLAAAIEQQSDFLKLVGDNDRAGLTLLLDEQFHRFFVTADIIKLVKLYVIDSNFKLLSASSEGPTPSDGTALACPELNRIAKNRTGTERLQVIASSCEFDGRPVYAVLAPFGGLSPRGYIQVVSDLATSMQHLDSALGMPLEIRLRNNELLYHSEDWSRRAGDADMLSVTYEFMTDDKNPAMHISLLSDMAVFNSKLTKRRDLVMLIAFISTALMIFVILQMLRRTTIAPLSRIQNVLEHLQSEQRGNADTGRILFSELLEQIIRLRDDRQSRFAVLMLDLQNFRAINETFGREAGDRLLMQIEDRITHILRHSDLVSWVGTDTPGHKLRPATAKTEYRATIARLGGDEFGLLLPSARSKDQAEAVARRIIDALRPPYTIDSEKVSIGCCIGISLYPEHGEDESVLIRTADKAMLEAGKQHGKYCIYCAESL